MRLARLVAMGLAANMVGPNLIFVYALRSTGNLIAACVAAAVVVLCGVWWLIENRSRVSPFGRRRT